MKKYLPILLCIALFSSCNQQETNDEIENETHPSSKPNIIFILADDLGYGELSSHGQKSFETPNIDQLAAEGIRFTDFYAGNTVCAPSRCALMTGKHPGHASIRGNAGWPDGTFASKQRVGITRADLTIGEVMQKAGYKTAHCGKWHLEAEADSLNNYTTYRGYDYTIREHFSKRVKDQRKLKFEEDSIVFDANFPYELWENGKRLIIPENFKERTHLMDDFTTQKGLDFIAENKENPFFVFFSMKIPHSPETLHRLDTLFANKNWPDCEKVHARRIVYHDMMVKQIVDYVDSLGLTENTVFMYSSDNGGHNEGMGKKPISVYPCQHDYTFFDSNAPLKGFKRDLYDGGIRVPFIVRWKGTVEPGQTSEHIGAFWDILATCADLGGVDALDYNHDGISIVPTMKKLDQPKHDYLYWEFFMGRDGSFRQAVRMGDWKGVRYRLEDKIELYNLKEDIAESKDLSEQYPEKIEQIDSLFKVARTENKHYPWGGIK